MHKQWIEHRAHGGSQLRAIARRRWRLAVATFSLPCAFALGLVAFLPSLYEARSLVLVDPPGMGGSEVSAARVEQLTKENLSQPRLGALLGKLGEAADAAAVQALRRDLDIETDKVNGPSGQTTIGVSIRVRGFEPHRAAQIANELAGFYIDSERARMEQEASAIDARITEARGRLDEQERRLKEFEAQHLRELPEQVQVHLASLESLNARLELIRMNRTKAAERVRAMSEQLATPPIAPPDPTEIELTRLRQSLAELRSRATEQHPDVVRMRREIENLEGRRKPAPAASPPVGRPREPDAELQALAREERTIEGRIAGVQREALNAAPRGQERASLLPSYEAARTSYTELLRRYEELQAKRGDDGERVPFHIVEEALPARQAALPNRTRLAGLAIIFSALAAAAAVWLREQVDRTFHTSSELRSFTRVPVLGHIPRIVTAADVRRRRWKALLGVLVLALIAYGLIVTAQMVARDGELFRLITRPGGP